MTRGILVAAIYLVVVGGGFAQVATPAGEKMAFDVASVRQNTTDEKPGTNVPLTKGDFYPPNGGIFHVQAMPLINILDFAYELSDYQKAELLAHAPGWVASMRLNIDAKSDARPTKDEMRRMMQTLLEERFKLALHEETKQVPIFAMVLVKPGMTGPDLKLHAKNDPACAKRESYCGAFGNVPGSVPGRQKIVGRDVLLQRFADELAGLGGLGRPVFDKTGLSGTVDFTFEWLPESDAAAQRDAGGSSFLEALKEQLGVRLESQKGLVTYVVVDHVEPPSEN